MGVFTKRLGIWAQTAAIVGALLSVSASADAASPTRKTSTHSAKGAVKRASVNTKPEAERAHSNSNKAASKPGAKAAAGEVKAAAKGAKTKPVRETKVPASSVGSPNEGKLVGGVKLDTSDGTVRVVPAYQRGDTRWGLPALIHMIERSAKKVSKKHPGAVLGVGDISRKNGGDIFLHRSHESGRDADIAFYVVDQRGKDLKPDTFVSFQGSIESSSMPGARFDVAKNWALVEAMLQDSGARVSHIFVADPLRRMLLAYAKHRVSPALYNRAAAVMMQPSNALPHDNHFHVRISCPAEMRQQCVEYPVGVFAKKGKQVKTKSPLVTPKSGAKAQTVATIKKPSGKGAVIAKVSPAKPKVIATPVAKKVGPAAPAPQKLASRDEKRKPIYLQSRAVNNNDSKAAGGDDLLDKVLFSVPALSHLNGAEPDGDADGNDVKAAVDETGTVKITE